MSIRTIEFIYYSAKFILQRDIFYGFKRIIVIGIEFGIITLCVRLLPNMNVDGYLPWVIQAIKVSLITCAIVLIVNALVYKENLKNIFAKLKVIVKN